MKEKIYMKKKLFERMILSTVNRLLHKKVTFQKKKNNCICKSKPYVKSRSIVDVKTSVYE